jgi:hypothetical protein
MDIVKRYSLRVKLHKLEKEAVFIQAILCELLNKVGGGKPSHRLVQGFCTAHGESCYHVWVKNDATSEDIDIIRYLFPEYQTFLTQEEVPGALKDQLTVDLYELYASGEQKDFWKKAPKKVLDFRSKCHSLASKSSC